ncbi:Peptidyl-tRNA hydrolase [Penicillium bovifimosum]|uniref:Peptidyl-tRNA hydrolase n=1 Tax=Penicillium bovifimosum TaxID=126998 RepID=A0A9W9L8J6_9EURO|nr:Peptidyl-tRNA hydrolase [Penicillium bovifimosum]KAJ5144180.1 Peptidyl-tRNA hydrolase [Penicillium bovifimosum]
MDPLPRRLLFIASIGNKSPYHKTRHSAGHLLLDAVIPLLQKHLPNTGLYHETWHSTTWMNESGPKLVRRLEDFAKERHSRLERIAALSAQKNPEQDGDFAQLSKGLPTTLIILHDELENQRGTLRVKAGGPEKASLRGHRGLISICETLRGKKLYPPRFNANTGNAGRDAGPGVLGDLSILRVGIGIGRPTSREKNAVSDYVLKNATEAEIESYRAMAGSVVDVIRDELYRPAGKV